MGRAAQGSRQTVSSLGTSGRVSALAARQVAEGGHASDRGVQDEAQLAASIVIADTDNVQLL